MGPIVVSQGPPEACGIPQGGRGSVEREIGRLSFVRVVPLRVRKGSLIWPMVMSNKEVLFICHLVFSKCRDVSRIVVWWHK